MDTDPSKYARNRNYRFVEEQQQALDDGAITEAEWFANHCRDTERHYLVADNPRAQSGHGGDEAAYRYTRMMVLEAVERGGTFLDVGCANGYLMESLERWLQGSGLTVEFHGLDISAAMLSLARQRLPRWTDRFHLGNALAWTPDHPFDYVYTAELEYVPRGRECDLVEHLLSRCVAPGGRLIVGPYGEERHSSAMADKLRGWGYVASGYCEKSHPRLTSLGLVKRMLWFDRTSAAARRRRLAPPTAADGANPRNATSARG